MTDGTPRLATEERETFEIPAGTRIRFDKEYQVGQHLGEGGMGKVYKARHQDMDRIVAVKMLPPGRLVSEVDKRRFQQEVKAAARLNHPNIVTAYDADVSGGAEGGCVH